MLDRNRRIKHGPQRLQATKRQYDLILTAEERVYDQVLHHFAFGTGSGGDADADDSGIATGQAVHVVNIDIQDNHEEVTIGAFLFCELVSNYGFELKSKQISRLFERGEQTTLDIPILLSPIKVVSTYKLKN